MDTIAGIRKEYKLQTLDETDLLPDPFSQFEKWWQQLLQSGVDEVNAMTLATASKTGIPSARIVLLKGFTTEGFRFLQTMKVKRGPSWQKIHMPALFFSGKNWSGRLELMVL